MDGVVVKLGADLLARCASMRAGVRAFKENREFETTHHHVPINRREVTAIILAQMKDIEFTLISWDTASTLGEDADWSVGSVWGVAAGQFYLLDVVRGRFETPDLRHRIESFHRDYEADQTIIEEDGIGRAIVQDLRRTSQWCKPILIKPRYEKLARMEARAVMFETSRVLVPKAAPWLGTYLEELLSFPNSTKDDQVDSTSQALDYLQRQFSATLRGRPEGKKRPKGGSRPLGAPRG